MRTNRRFGVAVDGCRRLLSMLFGVLHGARRRPGMFHLFAIHGEQQPWPEEARINTANALDQSILTA